MSFAVIGVNHKNCPIAIREKVTFTHLKAIEGMKTLKAQGIGEVIILSTCNRSEIYIYDSEVKKAIEQVKTFYEGFSLATGIGRYLFIMQEEEALIHLFEVAAGLDSIVVGEDQILGQVKTAQQDAMTEKTCGKVLNKIFREAISTAKEIKSKLKISTHPLSISHIAVKFLKEQQGGLKGKSGLIIGAGQMNRLTIKYLLEEELDALYVTSRTHMKAKILSEDYEGLTPILYEGRYKALEQVDFVVSATASPHLILQYEKMPRLNKCLDIIDIAVPRDVDPKINKLPFARVHDIDDLKAIAEKNNDKRLELASGAELVIKEAVEALLLWLEGLSIEQVVLGLNTYCEQVEQNTSKVCAKMLRLTEEEEEKIQWFMREALKRCMRLPISKLTGTKDVLQREVYAKVMTELFELSQGSEAGNENNSGNKG